MSLNSNEEVHARDFNCLCLRKMEEFCLLWILIVHLLKIIRVSHYLSTFSLTALKALWLFLLSFVVTKFCVEEFEREVWGQISIVSSEKIKYCCFCKGCSLANNLPLSVSFMYSIMSMLSSIKHVLFLFFFFSLCRKKCEGNEAERKPWGL